METINDVLNLLTHMELYKFESGIPYKTFNIARNILKVEFEDKTLDELYELLKTLDDLCTEYIRMNAYFDKTLLTTLRDKIFNRYTEKSKMIKKSDNCYHLNE